MGEVGEVIPEKAASESTTTAIPTDLTPSTTATTTTTAATAATTTSTTLTNGDLQNGIYKNKEDSCKNNDEKDDEDDDCMEVDNDLPIPKNGISDTSSTTQLNNLKLDLIKTNATGGGDSAVPKKNIDENDDEKKSKSSPEPEKTVNSVGKTSPSNTLTEEKKDSSKDVKKEKKEDKSSEPVVSSTTPNDTKQSTELNLPDSTKVEPTLKDEVSEKKSSAADSDVKPATKDESPTETVENLKIEKPPLEKKDELKSTDEKIKSKDDTKLEKPVKLDENSEHATKNIKVNGEVSASVPKKSPIRETVDSSADDIQVIESDDDEDPFGDISQSNEKISSTISKTLENSTKNATPIITSTTTTTTTAPAIDEDDAVIIQSDSENESDSYNKTTNINSAPIENSRKSSDDDDCVVIESDDDDNIDSKTPQNLSMNKISPSNTPNRARQRKSIVTVRDLSAFDNDISSLMEDQPPSKRQKTNLNNNTINGNNAVPLNLSAGASTLTIKDARTLCDTAAKAFQQSYLQSAGTTAASQPAVPNMKPISTFPTGIRPVLPPLSNIAAIPKLAPVSNIVNSNANLLPALTDDMFVLEAPSFIVPYIYEKPPSSNLKDIVAKLVNEFELTKYQDVKENQIDLELLQLKMKKGVEEEKKSDKKSSSKRRRKNNDGDDSWGESDESTDDEASDNESATRTKVLIDRAETNLDTIKSALAPTEQLVQQTNDPASGQTDVTGAGIEKPKTENYFDSPLGKFFTDIGVGLVQEYVQADLLKIQKRRLRKSDNDEVKSQVEIAINALTKNLDTSKKRNEPFKFEMKRCEFCNFKTESALTMANHYETPHMEKNLYKCNFCEFEIRQTQDIIFHMEAVHNVKGRLEKGPSYHQCPNCPFEDNGKSKMARHQPVCAKKYRPELNLSAPLDWEAPAKIPRIKPRHGLVGTATAYQAMAAQAAAQKAALATLQQQQQAARTLIAASTANRSRAPMGTAVGRQNSNKVQPIRNIQNNNMTNARGANLNINNSQLQIRQQTPQQPQQQQLPQLLPQNVILPNNYQISGGQLIQVAGSSLAIVPNSNNTFTFQSQSQKKVGQQPSISITPLPRQSNNAAVTATQNTTTTSITMNAAGGNSSQQQISINSKPGMKPGQNTSGNKTSFVICEICDGYIKDLEQLRNHMQWMHKVKIHPKMIYNRPPLNCQKCQFRFFTDQGLERHLLGSHGLVTSSMQEAANKGKDAGRCPVCGRMYQWKLLNHVSRDHNMTLKPAHLSYKCTVCTATFGMYKQFENHVYTAHSTVAKKAMVNDSKKTNSNSSSNNNNSTSNNNLSNLNRNNVALPSSHDSLLKPLRINDEITIIPQPATKKT